MNRRWKRCWCAGMSVLACGSACACGPFFPNTILDDADAELLESPAASFVRELSVLLPEDDPEFRGVHDWDQAQVTRQAEQEDLKQALAADGSLSEADTAAIGAYMETRNRIAQYRSARSEYECWQRGEAPWRDPVTNEPARVAIELPDRVPAAFVLYLKGAECWHAGQRKVARSYWVRLLSLPDAENAPRRAWAEYMLGRAAIDDEDWGEAVRRFRRVRDHVRRGAADAIGLAVASMGWEAHAELAQGNVRVAVDLYLAQHAAGDPSGLPSVRIVAERMLAAPPQDLVAFARDRTLGAVLTAYCLATQGGVWGTQPAPEAVGRWLNAVEAAEVQAMAGADRLAWTAYRVADMDAAGRWVARARPDSPIAGWLKAKLALRRGDRAAARQCLETALAAFPASDAVLPASLRNDIAGQLASLYMAGQRYREALDLFLAHGWWWDAAYVAEWVLSVDELKAHVDTQYPDGRKGYDEAGRLKNDAGSCDFADSLPAECAPAQIRYLLARRLARAGRTGEAGEYYPPHWAGRIQRYAEQRRAGAVKEGGAAARAEALWQAARMARYEGMELLGTELDPDWRAEGGEYAPESPAGKRRQARAMKLAGPSPDELRRQENHAGTHPTRRFHYRYLAADLAWQAAALMPDEAPETALVLCAGGVWLKDRDPQAADRFYKALVKRCGKTDLGRKAGDLRWFPGDVEIPEVTP